MTAKKKKKTEKKKLFISFNCNYRGSLALYAFPTLKLHVPEIPRHTTLHGLFGTCICGPKGTPGQQARKCSFFLSNMAVCTIYNFFQINTNLYINNSEFSFEQPFSRLVFTFALQCNPTCRLFCSFSLKLPLTHVGLHCNANEKTNCEKGFSGIAEESANTKRSNFERALFLWFCLTKVAGA